MPRRVPIEPASGTVAAHSANARIGTPNKTATELIITNVYPMKDRGWLGTKPKAKSNLRASLRRRRAAGEHRTEPAGDFAAVETLFRKPARPRAHLLELERLAGTIRDGPCERPRIAGADYESNRVLARDACDFGVLFHHRDEWTPSGENSVDLARHQAPGGPRRERNQMQVTGAQRFCELVCRLIGQEQHVLQTHRARRFLQALLTRPLAYKDEHDARIVLQVSRRIQHDLELLGEPEVARVHNYKAITEAGAERIAFQRRDAAAVDPVWYHHDFLRGHALGDDTTSHVVAKRHDRVGARVGEVVGAFEDREQGAIPDATGRNRNIRIKIADIVHQPASPAPLEYRRQRAQQRRIGLRDDDVGAFQPRGRQRRERIVGAQIEQPGDQRGLGKPGPPGADDFDVAAQLMSERTARRRVPVTRRAGDEYDLVFRRQIVAELGQELAGRLVIRPERAIQEKKFRGSCSSLKSGRKARAALTPRRRSAAALPSRASSTQSRCRFCPVLPRARQPETIRALPADGYCRNFARAHPAAR